MIRYRYVSTGQGEGSWGHELDRRWAPLFDPAAPRAFYADVLSVIGRPPPGPEDAGLCHSIALPGESYTWRLAHLPTPEIVAHEKTAISGFQRVYALSRYFLATLRERGIANAAGVLLYPTPPAPRAARVARRAIVAQRFSEEKMPALVIELARRMPDVDFVFTSAEPPEGLYRVWLDLAPANVSVRCFPRKVDYYEFVAGSGCGFVATLRDNFGVSALDCLAAGRPYVAPDLFAYPEIVQDRACLYEPFSLRDMERAIRHALSRTDPAEPPWTAEEAARHLEEMLCS
jgi:glycosyltransferase involved in cell wall biosynthesis